MSVDNDFFRTISIYEPEIVGRKEEKKTRSPLDRFTDRLIAELQRSDEKKVSVLFSLGIKPDEDELNMFMSQIQQSLGKAGINVEVTQKAMEDLGDPTEVLISQIK